MRVLALLCAAAALTLGTLPARAQSADCSSIYFELANPDPGARVETGDNVFQGVAFDTAAPEGEIGIERVDIFLGNRDQGGLLVGSVVPDTEAGPFGPGSFQTTVTLPNQLGAHDLFAYAHDSVTGQELVISEPIVLGQDPSQAFATVPPPPATVTQMCSVGENSTITNTTVIMPEETAASPAPAMPESNPMVSAPSAATIMLDIANPSPGDMIKVGALDLQGIAFDLDAPDAMGGIDKIVITLGDRDQGGVIVGQAAIGGDNTWTARVTIPSNQVGSHFLWFYAHSTITDQEMAVSIPVTIAP